MDSILWGDILYIIFAVVASIFSIGVMVYVIKSLIKNRKDKSHN